MSNMEDDKENVLSKADAFLQRKRTQLGSAMENHQSDEAADDIPTLTDVVVEVVADAPLLSKPPVPRDCSADIAREMEAWLDENLPQVVVHALDGIADRLISQIHESAQTDLLPRLKQVLNPSEADDQSTRPPL